jgi:putative peptidoglycan lipid II flippase
VPSSAGLIVLGDSMIGAIYQGGKFQSYDTGQTALALACYAIGLAGYAAIKVLAPAFYALGDSRTPMYVSLASIAINYIVASMLIRVAGMGHYGLALSTSAVAISGFAALFLLIRRRIGGVHGRALARSSFKILAASAVMAALVWTSSTGIQAILGARKLGYLADVAVSIPLGVAAFALAGRLLKIEELEFALGTLAPQLARARARAHGKIQ